MTNEEKYNTTKERVVAFNDFCREHGTCDSCPLNGEQTNNTKNIVYCAFSWLNHEYKAEKPLCCPFCGREVNIRGVGGLPQLTCVCGYASEICHTPDEAIKAHNDFVRKVKAI